MFQNQCFDAKCLQNFIVYQLNSLDMWWQWLCCQSQIDVMTIFGRIVFQLSTCPLFSSNLNTNSHLQEDNNNFFEVSPIWPLFLNAHHFWCHTFFSNDKLPLFVQKSHQFSHHCFFWNIHDEKELSFRMSILSVSIGLSRLLIFNPHKTFFYLWSLFLVSLLFLFQIELTVIF